MSANRFFERTLCALVVACVCHPTHADTFGSGETQFTIPFVTIGAPGNASDTTGEPNPAGSVD